MNKRYRSAFVAALSILATLCVPSGVSAGAPVEEGWNRLGGGTWYFGSGDINGDAQATALFEVEYWDEKCLDIQLVGSERQFKVLVTPAVQEDLGVTNGEGVTWQALLDCLPDGIPYPTDQAYWMIEAAAWAELQPGGLGEFEAARSFPCLEVSARERMNRDVAAIVALAGAKDLSEVPGLDIWQSGDVWDRYPLGSARFFDVRLVLFAVGLEGQIDKDETNLSWTFNINIRECGRYSGPDIEIEHYRRMAEEATALPDTR